MLKFITDLENQRTATFVSEHPKVHLMALLSLRTRPFRCELTCFSINTRYNRLFRIIQITKPNIPGGLVLQESWKRKKWIADLV